MQDTDESLLHFLYQVPVSIAQFDAQGGILLMNPFAAQMLLPLAPGSALDNIFTLLEPWLPDLRDQFTRESRSGLVLHNQLIQVEKPRSAFLSVTVNRLGPDHGVLVMQDVTERETIREQLDAQMREAEFLKGRQEASAAVLHDIGNAATALGVHASQLFAEQDWPEETLIRKVHGLLAGLKEELDRVLGAPKGEALVHLMEELPVQLEERRERIEEVAVWIQKGLHHVQEVLALQRRRNQQGHTRHGSYRLKEVTEDSLSLVSVQMERRGISLETSFPGDLPPLSGDPTRISRVILNLLRNTLEAFDRMEVMPDAPRISVSLEETDSSQTLTVTDNACGFDPGDAEKLFEQGVSRKADASGIGLFSCRKIIEDEGGSLILTSEGPGSGARAVLSLPVSPQPELETISTHDMEMNHE